jgi:biotin carboxyl carrier protein
MTFEIEVNGRNRTVSVDPVAGTLQEFHVTYDGRTTRVDAVRVAPDVLSLILPDAAHRAHEVRFSQGATAADLTVHLKDASVTATVNGRRARRGGPAAGTGEVHIVAPMPGRVLRVLVAVGEEAAARQPLIVVEAMKMENELSSPRPGRIKNIAVSVGQSVEAGRVLVVVE